MVYLDNAAAAPVAPELMELYRGHLESCFANQEAVHAAAYEIRVKLQDAAKRIAVALTGESEHYVHWGSSATALFNLICGYPGFDRRRLRASGMEHPALAAALKRLGNQGKRALTVRYHVQSETGEINELASVDKGDAVLLADTVQSAGKLAIPWREAQLDLIFCSGHKIGAPGGAALICRDSGIREFLIAARHPGYLAERPEPALCLTLADAMEDACRRRDARVAAAAKLKHRIIAALAGRKLPNGRKILLTAAQSSPFILHLIVSGYQSAVLVRMLSRHEIYVGAGSACQAESKNPSPALLALGFSREDAYAGLRLSFWRNTEAEIERFLQVFDQVIREY